MFNNNLVTKYMFFFIFYTFLSCSQDSDLLLNSILEEKEEISNDIVGVDINKGILVLDEDTSVSINIREEYSNFKEGKLLDVGTAKYGNTTIEKDSILMYVPNKDFHGEDTFSYTIEDPAGKSTTTMKVTVNAISDVVTDLVTTTKNKKTIIDVLKNDTFSKDSNVIITETSDSNKGIVVVNTDNTISYTSLLDNVGQDTFTYTTVIKNEDGSMVTEKGNVNITINSANKIAGKNIYYVTTNGTAISDGVSEETAWSITHAFKVAKAGDIVYIKAGNYGPVNLKVANSGTVTSPIQFIGYKNTPGDVESINGSTVTYEDYKNNGDKLDATVMPLLQGVSNLDEEWTGTAIVLGKKYLELSNIQISNYENGVVINAHNNTLKNIVTVNIGDFNPSHSYPKFTSNSIMNYKGIAMDLSANYLVVENSLVINAGAEGIRVNNSHYQTHRNNKVYSDNDTNPTDYYYLIANGSSNNVISNAYIERVGKLTHNGHGLVLKVSAENNKFNDCYIKNTILSCSFSGVKNNYFKNVIIEGGEDHNGSIYIANGSNNNIFENCVVDNAKGICFADWNDGFNDPRDLNDAGFQNEFRNCTVKNGSVGVNYYFWDETNSKAHDNIFKNCSFLNLNSLFFNDRPNNNNPFVNCKIENVKKLSSSIYEGKYELNFIYDNLTTFTNINFILP